MINIHSLFLVTVLSFQNIYFVEPGNPQVNVTRETDGDVLVLKSKVDCVSLNAKCMSGMSNTDKHEPTENKMCDTCKCLSQYTTYFSTENKCITTNDITTFNNCRIFRQRQTTVLSKSTKAISRPIQAYRCKITDRHPSIYSEEKNDETWIQMLGADILLKNLRRSRRRNQWLVTFNNNTISKMLSKYAGKLAKVKLSCKRRRTEKYSNLCIIFKIAGTQIITIAGNFYHDPHSPSSSSTYPTTTVQTTTTLQPNTTNDPSSEFENQKSTAKQYRVWIIIAVLIGIIIVLIGVISFIYVKRRKKQKSSEEHQSDDIMLHDYDVPMKSPFHADHKTSIDHKTSNAEDHVYATVSEVQNRYANSPTSPTCSTPNHYQELNLSDRGKGDVSHYQALVEPDQLEYVDILPAEK